MSYKLVPVNDLKFEGIYSYVPQTKKQTLQVYEQNNSYHSLGSLTAQDYFFYLNKTNASRNYVDITIICKFGTCILRVQKESIFLEKEKNENK